MHVVSCHVFSRCYTLFHLKIEHSSDTSLCDYKNEMVELLLNKSADVNATTSIVN